MTAAYRRGRCWRLRRAVVIAEVIRGKLVLTADAYPGLMRRARQRPESLDLFTLADGRGRAVRSRRRGRRRGGGGDDRGSCDAGEGRREGVGEQFDEVERGALRDRGAPRFRSGAGDVLVTGRSTLLVASKP
jgi:hypothetical protein